MGTCAVLGQAVGTAAALASPLGAQSIAGYFSPVEITRLQQRLLRDDAFLAGVRNADPADLARSATVTASSESSRGAATQVLDGVTRTLVPDFGPWADNATHRWESVELPAALELAWTAPQTFAEIHLTFDSGFERELTLSASDHATRKMIRGAQPELVRDYDVFLDGHLVVSVTDNILRKRIHRLISPVAASRLRIQIKTTQGVPHARLFEIRAYAL